MMFISIGIGSVLAIGLITVVSLATGGKVTGTTIPGQPALVGTSIKPFTLPELSGGKVTMPWAKGHPSVLVFFASWCTVCQGETPKIASYLNTHNTGKVDVIGIDANDQNGAAAAYVKKDHFNVPIAVDASGNVTSSTFGFEQLPETVFLNAKGVVTSVYYGAIPVSTLKSGIAALNA
jgi:cytochrome c biogenesis protein CcmG/thiol:disulfide interchange protein DsbE